MNEKLVLHEYAASGNCYKVRLTAALLGLPLERREYDILKGETRTPEFLATVNANGRIPVLQIGTRFIPERMEKCGSPREPQPCRGHGGLLHRRLLLPRRRLRFDTRRPVRPRRHAALMNGCDVPRTSQSCRGHDGPVHFFEQYNHEPNVATMRFWIAFVGEENLSDGQRASIPGKRAAGDAALALMDEHLAGRDWFVGDRPSLADIALYAYTHVAEEGGFRLAEYPAINSWLARVADQPGYAPM